MRSGHQLTHHPSGAKVGNPELLRLRTRPSETLPKISRLPAFVAGFLRVLSMATPGITNLAFFFTSAVAMLARDSSIVFTWPFLISHASAMLAVRAPFDMTADFIMGAIPC